MNTKICPRCKNEKHALEFYVSKKSKSGLSSYCKQCVKELNREKYMKRRKSKKELKEPIPKARDGYKICSKCKKEKKLEEFNKNSNHKDGLRYECRSCQKIIAKKYNYKNREKNNARSRKWYSKNKDKAKKFQRNWYDNNRNKLRKYHNEYKKRKIREDPAYRLLYNLRKRLSSILRGKRKKISTKDGIGCTPEELVAHIEAQWEEGMNWNNYGNGEGYWNIDHIKPYSEINTNDTEAVVRNNHWSNLRPLWYKENLSRPKKRTKITKKDKNGV